MRKTKAIPSELAIARNVGQTSWVKSETGSSTQRAKKASLECGKTTISPTRILKVSALYYVQTVSTPCFLKAASLKMAPTFQGQQRGEEPPVVGHSLPGLPPMLHPSWHTLTTLQNHLSCSVPGGQPGLSLAWRGLIWQLSSCTGGRYHSNRIGTCKRKHR